MPKHHKQASRVGRAVNTVEETAIAVILGVMTLITFANVVVRYVFNSAAGRWFESTFGVDLPGSIIWGLEATTFLFAWLVLFGVSYAVKITAHLGVDAVTNIVPPGLRRAMGLIAAAVCVAYAFLLLKGAWDYWANFANLPQTTGRWFPTGFQEMGRSSYRSWYAAVDIPMPEFLRFIEPIINDGEAYDKLPRFIPYAILPIGMALLLLRFIQATLALVRGETDSLIVSHEAEDAIDAIDANREG